MTMAVTGATGHLGRLAVEALLRRGVPAAEVVATGRSTDRLKGLAEQGVVVRRGDYDDPTSLRDAFTGVDQLLLVSGSEIGQRVRQLGNALQAAASAGVGFVAYTSIAKADTSTLLLAEEHRATEQLLAESGIPHALLHNGWYVENYTGQLPVHLEHGIVGAVSGALTLTPRVLTLGTAYVSSLGLGDIARPHLEALVAPGRSSSMSQLAGSDIVYVARVAVPRLMALRVDIGTCFPATRTSQGKVLLAALTPDELRAPLPERSRSGCPVGRHARA